MLEKCLLAILKKSGIDESILDSFKLNEHEPSPSKMYDGFKLPIEYVDPTQIHELSNTVISDLELETSTNSDINPVYHELTSPENRFAKQMISEFKNKFTSNVQFLKDSQVVISNAKYTCDTIEHKMDYDEFCEIWGELRDDANFIDKYSYMEWAIVEHLNHSSTFLQTWSLINIVSPIMSLLVPIIFFVFPFVLLRMKGIPITFEEYIETLREIAKHHFIGKVLNVRSLSIENIMYLGFTGFIYFMQIYQNTTSCIRFYNNIKRMNHSLLFIRDYVTRNITNMESFITKNNSLPTYQTFIGEVKKHMEILKDIKSKLENITPFSVGLGTCLNVGNMLKVFYKLHQNAEYGEAIRYSIGFDGYISNINGIRDNMDNGYIHNAIFSTKSTKIKNQYYPLHKNGPKKNNCVLKKNMIITGVNASGKTTFLKTTAINIIFTQQFGVGFYDKCNLVPFTHIHSYLNIPDTSGRDSLFQAESRRCKDIIDAIQNTQHTNSRHFCIFDELYSGTNPEEATKSAYSFLHYLSSYSNVRFILTTHYVSLCKKYKKSKHVNNYKMCVEKSHDGKIKYTYKIKKGISNLHGGVEILKNMNYPKEIINQIETYHI
jgi:hypothetical protein